MLDDPRRYLDSGRADYMAIGQQEVGARAVGIADQIVLVPDIELTQVPIAVGTVVESRHGVSQYRGCGGVAEQRRPRVDCGCCNERGHRPDSSGRIERRQGEYHAIATACIRIDEQGPGQ